jgi:ATP phosphoribosyltransferase
MLIESSEKLSTEFEGVFAANTMLETLKITLPTGRIEAKVLSLLEQIGLKFISNGRSYRPLCNDNHIEAKMLKAQNIPSMVALGKHDCGFTGHDWVVEQEADVVELLDLGFDPVRIVAAMPEQYGDFAALREKKPDRPLVVASQYCRLAQEFIKKWNLNAIFVQAYGATEALPPEDADIIIDNVSTGRTLYHNRLAIIDEIMQSSTRFICNKQVLTDKTKRTKIDELTMLMKSTVQARAKVLLEMNVSEADFEKLVKDLPCMRAPTVSRLHDGNGYAVKVAVPVDMVPTLIPKLVASGATDILEYKLEKIIG